MSDTVERAFGPARSGTCRSVEDIRRALNKERCDGVDSHLSSDTLKRQLREAMKTAEG